MLSRLVTARDEAAARWVAARPAVYSVKALLDHALRVYLSSTAVTPASLLRYPRCPGFRRARLHSPLTAALRRRLAGQRPWAALIDGLYGQGGAVWAADAFAARLARAYERLAQTLATRPGAGVNVVAPPWEYPHHPDVLRRMGCLRACFVSGGEGLGGLYLHGSYALGDAVPGYSDLDALWVLPAEACMDPAALGRARKTSMACAPHLYSFDRQQHHEWFVLTGFEAHLGDGVYYPPALWREARSLAGKMTFSVAGSDHDAAGARWALLSLAVRTVESVAALRIANWYALKNTLSYVALLPALGYQARGEALSKAEAIARAAEEWDAGGVLALASRLRQEWGEREKGLPGAAYCRALAFNPHLSRLCGGLRDTTPKWVRQALPSDFGARVRAYAAALAECRAPES
ncbi:MAG TPA: hypothetical protein ENJ19_04270 [Gammaproteobacteria bacterium]|nr:hypothetical protein [Gammaproteobacteria bacterium]